MFVVRAGASGFFSMFVILPSPRQIEFHEALVYLFLDHADIYKRFSA